MPTKDEFFWKCQDVKLESDPKKYYISQIYIPDDVIKRLRKEYIKLEKDPVEFVKAVIPLDNNYYECHFCVSLFNTLKKKFKKKKLM